MTAKEQFDIRTMRYFIPQANKHKTRITKQDEEAMAALSSKGTKPAKLTDGLKNLMWGKTYRDLQITQWSEDVKAGIITKAEIYAGLPAWLQPWAEQKLRYVPYDIDAYEITDGEVTHHATSNERMKRVEFDAFTETDHALFGKVLRDMTKGEV